MALGKRFALEATVETRVDGMETFVCAYLSIGHRPLFRRSEAS